MKNKPVQRIDRKLYDRAVRDPRIRKALAFAILMKTRKAASVIKGWSYKKLSRISGRTAPTCKRRIEVLKELGLVKMYQHKGLDYLEFLPLKAPKKQIKGTNKYKSPHKSQNVYLCKIKRSSEKNIERGLQATLYVTIQERKDYARQWINAKQTPSNSQEYKRAEKICRLRGWSKFSENGISYKYIARILHCSPNTVCDIIRYGEKQKIFKVRRFPPAYDYIGPNMGADAFKLLHALFYTSDCLGYHLANQYYLPGKKRKTRKA